MRLSEFATPKSIAFIKLQFEKTLKALILAAEKEEQIKKNAKDKDKRDKESQFIKKIRNKHGITALSNTMKLNKRPKR